MPYDSAESEDSKMKDNAAGPAPKLGREEAVAEATKQIVTNQ